jgi:hypothetical protein
VPAATAKKPDYYWGCMMCGKKHHRNTTIGMTQMNKKCFDRYDRLSKLEKLAVVRRSQEKPT